MEGYQLWAKSSIWGVHIGQPMVHAVKAKPDTLLLHQIWAQQ
jgi:hypothetical protein